MRRSLAFALSAALASLVAASAEADGVMPPWTEVDDLPLPTWASSVAPKKNDEALFAGPARDDHRGSVLRGARFPLYGAKRGAGCGGRWLLIGPLAWICSDVADLSPDEPALPPVRTTDDGLPYRYFFVGHEGASGFSDLDRALDDAPDADLDPGFAVAVVEERSVRGERWVRTRSGYWVRAHDVREAHSSTFRGAEILEDGSSPGPANPLDVAWVVADRANEYAEPHEGKSVAVHARFDRVRWREEHPAPGGIMIRVSEDGAPSRWMRAKDLAHPTIAPPPPEVTSSDPRERWIDVELATQTLVAYEGVRPVFATLVSSGRGAAGSETATPLGVHRLWVKLLSSNMDNLENDDADQHYSIEDVPYVQFFDGAVALHGAFWHDDFGRTHSHGCVNLAPRDARWLFAFTSPHLPAGWSAVMPMRFEKGSVVRVR